MKHLLMLATAAGLALQISSATAIFPNSHRSKRGPIHGWSCRGLVPVSFEQCLL